MGALIIKVFEGNWIYAMIISFFNVQPIKYFKFFLRYMWLKEDFCLISEKPYWRNWYRSEIFNYY